MSSRRIVLFEQTGEIVFEGVSVLDEKPMEQAEREDDDADACPPTQRSPQSSGFFAVIPRAKGERAA
ncbi:MAG TPA: hypothetical protein VIF62_10855 [Labilithrix sp.]|jgi:hypothetical protein